MNTPITYHTDERLTNEEYIDFLKRSDLGAKLAVPRPMTHDLLSRLLEVNKTHVEKVAVTTLHDTTFYATLWLRVGDRVHEVDARPSDALSLALRLQAPHAPGSEYTCRGASRDGESPATPSPHATAAGIRTRGYR